VVLNIYIYIYNRMGNSSNKNENDEPLLYNETDGERPSFEGNERLSIRGDYNAHPVNRKNRLRPRRFSGMMTRRLFSNSEQPNGERYSDGNIEKKISQEGQLLFSNAVDETGKSQSKRNLVDEEATTEADLAELGMNVLSMGLSAANKRRLQQYAKDYAASCADCVGGDAPRWCVLNFGVFVCDECAGAHRALPATVHGGVRSVFLDEWTDEMLRMVVEKGGNDEVNAMMEYHVPDDIRKPKRGVTRGEERREWVDRKYCKREFVRISGMDAKEARTAEPSKSLADRSHSFVGGQEVLVGVIDLTVLAVENLPKPHFQSRRLSGGFILRVNLGRFSGTTQTQFQGENGLTIKYIYPGMESHPWLFLCTWARRSC